MIERVGPDFVIEDGVRRSVAVPPTDESRLIRINAQPTAEDVVDTFRLLREHENRIFANGFVWGVAFVVFAEFAAWLVLR